MITQRKPTYKYHLAGGQSRLREAILYVCKKCESDQYFGLTKLNKILWSADFNSFAERGQPVTGRTYQRLEFGPAPVEMLPVLTEMQNTEKLKIEITTIQEKRPIALVEPMLRDFSPSDIDHLERAIAVFWGATGKETSDRSHGVAWMTRKDGDQMPYELAYFSDEAVREPFLKKVSAGKNWVSQ